MIQKTIEVAEVIIPAKTVSLQPRSVLITLNKGEIVSAQVNFSDDKARIFIEEKNLDRESVADSKQTIRELLTGPLNGLLAEDTE